MDPLDKKSFEYAVLTLNRCVPITHFYQLGLLRSRIEQVCTGDEPDLILLREAHAKVMAEPSTEFHTQKIYEWIEAYAKAFLIVYPTLPYEDFFQFDAHFTLKASATLSADPRVPGDVRQRLMVGLQSMNYDWRRPVQANSIEEHFQYFKMVLSGLCKTVLTELENNHA